MLHKKQKHIKMLKTQQILFNSSSQQVSMAMLRYYEATSTARRVRGMRDCRRQVVSGEIKEEWRQVEGQGQPGLRQGQNWQLAADTRRVFSNSGSSCAHCYNTRALRPAHGRTSTNSWWSLVDSLWWWLLNCRRWRRSVANTTSSRRSSSRGYTVGKRKRIDAQNSEPQ